MDMTTMHEKIMSLLTHVAVGLGLIMLVALVLVVLHSFAVARSR